MPLARPDSHQVTLAPALGFGRHNHAHCAEAAMHRAEAMAATGQVKLTPVRRKVLEILLQGHRALGAYDILGELAKAGFANQPPLAYRALDFLVDHGLAHRIQRLNAYIACSHPGADHAPAFLICTACQTVAEAPADGARRAIDREAAALGFAIERCAVEALGLCPDCRGQATA